jgi:hypothetical protein
MGSLSHSAAWILGSGVLLAGCSEDTSGKQWSALATCLAGPAAAAPVTERVPKLRQILLGNSSTASAKDTWPSRCAPMADDLYGALDKSGKTAMLKRKLNERFGCNDTKGSCKIAGETSLISTTTELWESAKTANLTIEPAPNVPAPAAAPPPLIDAKSWKSLSEKPARVSGPVLASDGRALLVLKPAEGRARPSACEFAPGFSKVRCVKGSDKIPELPAHSLDVVNDTSGLYAAGLTEKGLVAYNLETGETSAVRGRSDRLIRTGVVAEKAAKLDISATPGAPEPPKPGAKPSMFQKPKGAAADEGFIAVELKDGKEGKAVKLSLESPVGNPITLGNQILYLTPTEKGVELGVKSLRGGRIASGGALKGTFAGAFHTCQSGDRYALATYGSRKGQGMSAKATAGDDKTAVTFTTFDKGKWSTPAEATMPFERSGESELSCHAGGASVAWMKADKGSALVGRIDCNAEGCKSSEQNVAGLDSTYLWAVGTLGEKVFVLYRGALGETKVRVAPLAELAGAKDITVFDTGDFGGPTTGELIVLATEPAALLLFRGEQPVALRLGNDGAVTVLSPS